MLKLILLLLCLLFDIPCEIPPVVRAVLILLAFLLEH